MSHRAAVRLGFALVALLGSMALLGAGARAGVPWGVVPDVTPGAHVPHSPLAHVANLPYDGGPVMHTNRTHLIFWQPDGSGLTFDGGYAQQLQTFLARVAHDSHLPTNVYGLTGQYIDGTGAADYASSFAGAILDTDPLPGKDPQCNEPAAPPDNTGPGWSDCVTDTQIQAELTHVAAIRHLPAGLRDAYFMITPNGLGSCDTGSFPVSCALGGSANNGYCGYHSATQAGLLYAVIPYNAVSGHCQSDSPRPNGSTADPTLSTLSHEHNETITDPLGSAWIDASFNEDGDLCLDMSEHPPPALGGSGGARYDQMIDGGRYWLQGEWSNEDRGCRTHDEWDPLSLRAPRRGTAKVKVTLRGKGRDPDGRITSYMWFLGDGHTARAATVKHAYRRPGRYAIVLRSTDSAGNWSYATGHITIVKPPARHPASKRRR